MDYNNNLSSKIKHQKELAEFSRKVPDFFAHNYEEQLANAKKGITYRWIPNHLQDADGRIAPRSFLKLFVLILGYWESYLLGKSIKNFELIQKRIVIG